MHAHPCCAAPPNRPDKIEMSFSLDTYQAHMKAAAEPGAAQAGMRCEGGRGG